MGYPMTYPRVVNRNVLTGDYDGTQLGLIAGDMRRLEMDQRDERHLSKYARVAGVTLDQAARLLDAFFSDFGAYPQLARRAAALPEGSGGAPDGGAEA